MFLTGCNRMADARHVYKRTAPNRSAWKQATGQGLSAGIRLWQHDSKTERSYFLQPS